MSLTTSATQTMSPQSSSSSSSDDKLDGVLPLSYKVVTRDADKQAALRLVADSIAQQRQTASAAVIFHPLCITVLVGMSAIAYRRYQDQGYGTLMTMLSGVAIMYLAAVRFYTSKYIELAESFRWKAWLTGPDDKEDTIIAAIFGEEIIGTAVLRLQPSTTAGKKGSKQTGKGGQGVIRAWTTRLRYRGKGVGSDLLQFAVQATRDAFGPNASVEFAPDHANSVNPLHDIFNRPFKKRQTRAEQALAHALESGATKK